MTQKFNVGDIVKFKILDDHGVGTVLSNESSFTLKVILAVGIVEFSHA
jgi:hypothetical protein